MTKQIDTQTLQVDPAHPEAALIQRAADVLLGGGLVAFPTETVYGLGANAFDPAAIERIFAAKGRPSTDPLIVHIATSAQLDRVAQNLPPLAHELAQAFWPGPLTLVLKRRPTVPAAISAGRATVAVRMPQHPIALALIEAAGVPVAAPSANTFTRPSPTLAAHVLEDLAGRIELLLDGGPTSIGLESTVLDLTQELPVVLRPGGVPIEALQHMLPDLRFTPEYRAHSDAAAPAPGMLLKHYSPRAELLLFSGSTTHVLEQMQATAQAAITQGRRVGIMALDEDLHAFRDLGVVVVSAGPAADLAEVGRRMFATMRALDQQGVDLILTRDVARTSIGLAIWDRLVRAAEGRVIEVGEGSEVRG